jgi:hypothetical protein
LYISVLPSNRPYVADFLNADFFGDVSTLARGPLDKRSDNAALQILVEDKIERQDRILRRRLRSLKYQIDASDTIRLLCGKGPVESVRAFP